VKRRELHGDQMGTTRPTHGSHWRTSCVRSNVLGEPLNSDYA
jgi:hypothetical protein